jgi:DNA (cytosine-5)-methyltransferase 1
MKPVIRHLELFAGIGGFRRAIELFCRDNNFKATCVGFSEIDSHAVRSYKAIHDTSEEIELGDIQEFTRDPKRLKSLSNFSLLTGGFPCQSFSMMGKKEGFEDKRGEVFYRIIDILKEKKPKFILLENVRNLRTHDNKNTFKEIIRSLNQDANYSVDSVILDTKKFGLPQTRRRVFIFGIHKDFMENDHEVTLKDYEVESEALSLNGSTSLNKYQNVLDILEREVDAKYYLSEKIKPTILANGSKNFESKSEINQLIARPLTASMVKMHRACQDNYYSDEFLLSDNPSDFFNGMYSKEEQATKSIRKITPEEAFMLQGFNREDTEKARAIGVSNHQLYRQAGNAVSVNTVYALLHYLNKKYNLFNG